MPRVAQLRLRSLATFRRAGDAEVRQMLQLVLKAHRRQSAAPPIEATAPVPSSQHSQTSGASDEEADARGSPPASPSARNVLVETVHPPTRAAAGGEHPASIEGAHATGGHQGLYVVIRDGRRARAVLDTSRLPPFGPARRDTAHVRAWSAATGAWNATHLIRCLTSVLFSGGGSLTCVCGRATPSPPPLCCTRRPRTARASEDVADNTDAQNRPQLPLQLVPDRDSWHDRCGYSVQERQGGNCCHVPCLW